MRGWNLYHKMMVAAFAAIIASLFLRAIQSINGGAIVLEQSLVLAQTPEALWPLLSESENRARWEAQIFDITALSGEKDSLGSTRFLFWRDDRGHRSHWLERTEEKLDGRFFVMLRQSDDASRGLRVSVEPLDACHSQITLEEWVRPEIYGRRFLAFLERGRYDLRLDQSVAALKRWADRLPVCAALP